MKRSYFLTQKQAYILIGFISMVGLLTMVGFGLRKMVLRSSSNVRTIEMNSSQTVIEPEIETEQPIEIHTAIPEEVRGIYWTSQTAGSKRADELLSYMKLQKLNTVVIDVKTDDGQITFLPKDQTLIPYIQKKLTIPDLDGLLIRLKNDGIYRIARIAVMRDGMFATVHPDIALKTANGNFWKDSIGSIWVDPSSPQVAEYAISLAREAYARGFDEVQFDYIRFASDGKISTIRYPIYKNDGTKVAVMQNFFQIVGDAMKQSNIPISFDVFGMTFWSDDDFNIGQRLQDVFPNASFVSPMVYPSHYPNGFEGFENPALFPYEIVKRSLDKGTEQLLPTWTEGESALRKHFRPWLQAFNIGAVYTQKDIEAQIKAARDAGASGWIFWNARNVYE